MKQNIVTISILLTAAIFAGCSKKEPAQTPPNQKESETTTEPTPDQPGQLGQKAATLEDLTIVKGSPVTFEQGSVYVVEFWATWCGPCKRSIPHLTEVQKSFRDKNVTVIGITREKSETVTPFVAEMGDTMDYTVAIDTEGTVHDNYMKAFDQGGIPCAFIVNGNGCIVWVGHPAANLEATLDQVIAGTFDIESYRVKLEEERKAREIRNQQLKAQKAEFNQKIAEATAAIDKDPQNASLWVARAETYLGENFTTKPGPRSRDMLKAVEDYKKASELAPNDAAIAEQVAFFDAWNDKTDEKENRLKAFIQNYPDSVRAPFAMYAIQYLVAEKKNFDEAVKYLTLIEENENLSDSFRDAAKKRKALIQIVLDNKTTVN